MRVSTIVEDNLNIYQSPTGNRNPNVCLLETWTVIDAVSGHGHCPISFLKFPNDPEFLFWRRTRKHYFFVIAMSEVIVKFR